MTRHNELKGDPTEYNPSHSESGTSTSETSCATSSARKKMVSKDNRQVKEVVGVFEMWDGRRAREVVATYPGGDSRREIEVGIDGGYTPSYIELKDGVQQG